MVTHVSEGLPVPRAGLGTADRGKDHGRANADDPDPANGSHVKNRITDGVAQQNVREIARDHDHVPVTVKNHVNPLE